MSDEDQSQDAESGDSGSGDTTPRSEGGDGGGWDYPDLDTTNIKGGEPRHRIEANDDSGEGN